MYLFVLDATDYVYCKCVLLVSAIVFAYQSANER